MINNDEDFAQTISKNNLDFTLIYANKFSIIDLFLHGLAEKFQRCHDK